MRDHITGVMTHYRGVIPAWDVVTEAFDERGRLRQLILDPAGPEHGLDRGRVPHRPGRRPGRPALLQRLQHRQPHLPPRRRPCYAMVADFKARGVPIDCVGLESHFCRGSRCPPNYQGDPAERFAALGVEVQITELDIAGTATQADRLRPRRAGLPGRARSAPA